MKEAAGKQADVVIEAKVVPVFEDMDGPATNAVADFQTIDVKEPVCENVDEETTESVHEEAKCSGLNNVQPQT